MSNRNRFLVGIAFAAMLSGNLTAQSIYGTLTGIVSDPSQAVVAGAAITLRDQQSGSQRDTLTNSDGYYTFSSVPPGAYELTVVAKGFETHKQTGIALGGGDKLNYNVSLKVGNTNQRGGSVGDGGRGGPGGFRRELEPAHHQGTGELHPTGQQRRGVSSR